MKYFSGFSLKDDDVFFKDILDETSYCVSGFSYGAIKAFEFVEKEIEEGRRVDVLQLISPAFFQTKSDKFKRIQTISYIKSEKSYLENFLKMCFNPYAIKDITHTENNIDELNKLLYFIWDKSKIQKLSNIGVRVEVYLGSEDQIIDSLSAYKFFMDVSTVTYIKNANHFLQIN